MPPDKFSYPDKPGQPFVIPKEEMPQVKSLSDRELKELGLIEGKSKRKRISRENVEVSPEMAKARFSPFLADTFHIWYDSAKTRTPAEIDSAAQHLPEIIEPTHLDWAAKKDEPADASKFGEYTLNPNTVGLDWETIPENKIKIITLPEALSGKPLAEVGKYILDTYSSDYHLPSIEYWQYILNNPNKAPAELKDKNYHFFFGSLLRGADGYWRVPYARWNGAVWDRDALWLASVWFSDYRVVLVEK